jgi:hypothetical protein
MPFFIQLTTKMVDGYKDKANFYFRTLIGDKVMEYIVKDMPYLGGDLKKVYKCEELPFPFVEWHDSFISPEDFKLIINEWQQDQRHQRAISKATIIQQQKSEEGLL